MIQESFSQGRMQIQPNQKHPQWCQGDLRCKDQVCRIPKPVELRPVIGKAWMSLNLDEEKAEEQV